MLVKQSDSTTVSIFQHLKMDGSSTINPYQSIWVVHDLALLTCVTLNISLSSSDVAGKPTIFHGAFVRWEKNGTKSRIFQLATFD